MNTKTNKPKILTTDYTDNTDKKLSYPFLSALSVLSVVLLFFLLALPLRADDTNTPPVPTSGNSFFQTATAYFTSFNTNAEMGWTQRGELSAGVASLQGPVNLANDLRLSYEVGKNFGVESTTRDSGIAGTWLSQGLGVNYSFKLYDAKLTVYSDGGYRFREPDHRYFGEFGLRVAKKMTRFTYAGVSIGAQVPTGREVFTAFAGFTF